MKTLVWHKAIDSDELPEVRVGDTSSARPRPCSCPDTWVPSVSPCPRPWARGRQPGNRTRHGTADPCISGDGGFGQYMGDLTTLVKYGMNITHVLLNNGELGKISKEQRAGSWDVWQTSLHNPNFAEFATNCGALGIRVAEAQDVAAAVERALAHPGPALVEVLTDVELI